MKILAFGKIQIAGQGISYIDMIFMMGDLFWNEMDGYQ